MIPDAGIRHHSASHSSARSGGNTLPVHTPCSDAPGHSPKTTAGSIPHESRSAHSAPSGAPESAAKRAGERFG
eukprot:15452702-Alexandrium_andersonii.AAC.1